MPLRAKKSLSVPRLTALNSRGCVRRRSASSRAACVANSDAGARTTTSVESARCGKAAVMAASRLTHGAFGSISEPTSVLMAKWRAT